MKKYFIFLACFSSILVINHAHGQSETMIQVDTQILSLEGPQDAESIQRFSGDAKEVAKIVSQLQVAGTHLEQIQLTLVENQLGMIRAGGAVAIPSGSSVARVPSFPGGRSSAPRVQTEYQREAIGSLLTATARIDGDSVLMEYSLERSGVNVPQRKTDDEEAGKEVIPGGTESLEVQGTFRVGNNQTIVVGGISRTSEKGTIHNLVLATVRFTKPAGPRKVMLKLFPLKHVDANAASKMISEVLGRPSSLLIVPDQRLNTLVVRGDQNHLTLIEDLLKRIDPE